MPTKLLRLKDPLVVDRKFDLFFIIAWFIYALWGYLAFSNGLQTITDSLGHVFNRFWTAGIGATGSIAFVAAISLFWQFHFRGKAVRQITKKRVELTAVSSLCLLISIYPIYLFFAGVDGDSNRLISSVSSSLYVLIPAFRIIHLIQRIRIHGRA